MTKVIYNTGGPVYFLQAKGHAGGGTKGNDIICAGISAVTQALLNILINDEGEEAQHIYAKWEMDEDSGALRISAKAKDLYGETIARAYFKMAVMGLAAIAENYPGNIELKEVKNGGSI